MDIVCFHCGLVCSKPAGQVKRNLKLGRKNYCSPSCYQANRGADPVGYLVSCAKCGKDVYRDRWHINRNKTGKYFCAAKCRYEYSGKKRGNTVRYKAFTVYGKSCVGCSEKREYCLSVHHIDGDESNNIQSNWEVVCHTCHAIRHLKLIDDVWKLDFASLTPREMIKSL